MGWLPALVYLYGMALIVSCVNLIRSSELDHSSLWIFLPWNSQMDTPSLRATLMAGIKSESPAIMAAWSMARFVDS